MISFKQKYLYNQKWFRILLQKSQFGQREPMFHFFFYWQFDIQRTILTKMNNGEGICSICYSGSLKSFVSNGVSPHLVQCVCSLRMSFSKQSRSSCNYLSGSYRQFHGLLHCRPIQLQLNRIKYKYQSVRSTVCIESSELRLNHGTVEYGVFLWKQPWLRLRNYEIVGNLWWKMFAIDLQ